jgi:hypothetical protein
MARFSLFADFFDVVKSHIENLTCSLFEIYFTTVSAVYVFTSFQFQNIYILRRQDYDTL